METKKVEINCTTGEVVEREMTKAELTAETKFQEDSKKVNSNDLSQTSEALAKVEARKAILDRLGITAEEAALLLS